MHEDGGVKVVVKEPTDMMMAFGSRAKFEMNRLNQCVFASLDFKVKTRYSLKVEKTLK